MVGFVESGTTMNSNKRETQRDPLTNPNPAVLLFPVPLVLNDIARAQPAQSKGQDKDYQPLCCCTNKAAGRRQNSLEVSTSELTLLHQKFQQKNSPR